MTLGKNNGLIILEKIKNSSNIYKYIKGGKCSEKIY